MSDMDNRSRKEVEERMEGQLLEAQALWLHRRFLSLNLIMHFSRKHSDVPSEANQHIPELWRMLEEKLGTEKLKCVLSTVAQERPLLLHHLVNHLANHLARVCHLNFDFTASFLGSISTSRARAGYDSLIKLLLI